MVSKGMGLSQYAPKGVKSLCITSSQTVYVRKPDLVLCKNTREIRGSAYLPDILEHLLSKGKIRGSAYMRDRLICSIYGSMQLSLRPSIHYAQPHIHNIK